MRNFYKREYEFERGKITSATVAECVCSNRMGAPGGLCVNCGFAVPSPEEKPIIEVIKNVMKYKDFE